LKITEPVDTFFTQEEEEKILNSSDSEEDLENENEKDDDFVDYDREMETVWKEEKSDKKVTEAVKRNKKWEKLRRKIMAIEKYEDSTDSFYFLLDLLDRNRERKDEEKEDKKIDIEKKTKLSNDISLLFHTENEYILFRKSVIRPFLFCSDVPPMILSAQPDEFIILDDL
jgi:hypothetical protein